MIKAILVDDEAHCLETLNILLQEYCPEVQIIEQCCSSNQALESIRKFKPNLVFLDIQMPGMNGFELLDQFAEITFAVIFITCYEQYAIKAIHYSALDYLLKPINPYELIKAVKKIQVSQLLATAEQFQMLFEKLHDKKHQFTRIAVPTAEGYELVPAEQVIRCEADDNYTHIFLKGNNKVIACRTLKEIEEQLHNFAFFVRVHHSYLINLNEVLKYVRGEGGYLVMSDGSTVNVSRSRKEALLKLF